MATGGEIPRIPVTSWRLHNAGRSPGLEPQSSVSHQCSQSQQNTNHETRYEEHLRALGVKSKAPTKYLGAYW